MRPLAPRTPLRFALLATLAPALLAGASSDRLPIVDRAIAHHGGTCYEASETELDLCSKSGCFHVRAKVQEGRFAHTVEGRTRAGTKRVHITNDHVSWWLDSVPQPVEDAQRLRDWVMARVYFPFLPFRLNDPEVHKEDLGQERWGDRDLVRVRVRFTPGSSTDADDAYTYWFDPASGEVAQFAYSYTGDPGGLRFRRVHNLRRVGGILFFDQENLGAEGNDLSVDQITPAFVASRLRPVSTVSLKNIEVRALEPAACGPHPGP